MGGRKAYFISQAKFLLYQSLRGYRLVHNTESAPHVPFRLDVGVAQTSHCAADGSEILYRLYVLPLAFLANIRLQALDPIYANDSETSVLKTLGKTKKDKP